MKHRILFTLLATGLLSASHVHAADPTCQFIETAAAKAQQQPAWHSIMEMEEGSRVEMISLGEVTYMKADRGWMKIPANAGKLGQASAQALGAGESKIHDCRKLGSEDVAGIATTAYAYTVDVPEVKLFGKVASEAKTTTGTYYIGSDGLPYAHATEGTKQRWQYTGVTAPIP